MPRLAQQKGEPFDRLRAGSFDKLRAGSGAPGTVRILPQNSPQKISIPYSDIAALAFTGRDMAAGKSWEAWVRNYWEKKAAGEQHIALEPEELE